MQVSQSNDHITHAVIGQEESVSMGMSEDAALMHILSSSLYTYPKRAAVQEVICNGWDGHIIANKLDVPLEITVTDTEFKVKDFGPGIAHADIGPIYGTYGNSTKRTDPTQTGGFGLGSKAPFAYTDNFEVISCHEGTKTIYRVSKSSMEKMGKPTINKIVSMPTEESGITVSYSLRPNDSHEFVKLVFETVLLGGILAKVNGNEPVEPLPLLESPTGYLINSVSGTLISRINVRYGNVVYPVPKHTEFETEWTTVMSAMNRLWSNANIMFMAPPDSVSIAPNRESLNFTEETVATIKKLLGQFSPKELRGGEVTVKQMMAYLVNQKIESQPPTITCAAMIAYMSIDGNTFKGAHHFSGPYAFTLRKARLAHLLQQSDHHISGLHLFMKRFESAIRRKAFPDMKFAKAMRKAIYRYWSKPLKDIVHSYMKACIHKHLTLPLYQYIDAQPKMSRDRLFFTENNYHHGCGKLISTKHGIISTPQDGLAFVGKRALIVRSKKAASEFLWGESKDYGNGWVVYLVGSHPDRAKEARDMFTSLGYTVSESIPDRSPQLNLAVGNTVYKPSPKRKGYLTLAQSHGGHTFLLSRARQNGSLAGLLDPIAWVELDNKNSHSEGMRFEGLSQEECEVIHKLWGDKIAVVAGLQKESMRARGIPNVKTYVLTHVDKTLANRYDFPRYLAFAKKLDKASNKSNDVYSVMRSMLSHQTLMQELGIRFALSAETEMLLTFYKNRDNSVMPECSAMAMKVKTSPKLQEIEDKITNSPWKDFLDLDQLIVSLRILQPDSPSTKIPYEVLRHLLT